MFLLTVLLFYRCCRNVARAEVAANAIPMPSQRLPLEDLHNLHPPVIRAPGSRSCWAALAAGGWWPAHRPPSSTVEPTPARSADGVRLREGGTERKEKWRLPARAFCAQPDQKEASAAHAKKHAVRPGGADEAEAELQENRRWSRHNVSISAWVSTQLLPQRCGLIAPSLGWVHSNALAEASPPVAAA